MNKGLEDQNDAKILLDHGGSEAGTGFKCQQAVEKYLKAVLVSLGVNPPRRHQIAELRQMLVHQGVHVPADFDDLDLLDPYAVEERYSDTGISGAIDMNRAYVLVQRVRLWALQQVK